MLENAHRKIILISILLIGSALLLIVPERPLRMGLDLAGGTRLVYSIPIDEARKTGQVSADESDAAILADTIAIFRNRIDPTGVIDPIIRNAGGNRIEIQLPGVADLTTVAANATLAAWLAERGALPALPGGFYRVSQGREVGFDAIIELRVDAAGDVWSGGRAVAVVQGTLDWPD